MDATTCTHRDIAQALGVSETTIKSYRAKFATFLPVARQGKPVRLHPEALDVCQRIRDLFADGLSILQVHAALQSEFKEYPLNRRLSTSQMTPAAPALFEAAAPAPASPDPSALAEHLAALALAQEQSRARMEQLEAEVRNLATLEAASKSLVAELLAELRAARSAAPILAPILAPAAAPVSQPVAGFSGAPLVAPPLQPEPSPVDASVPASEPISEPVSEPVVGESGAAPTMLTARKIVTLHGASGPVASYALAREPKPAPLFPEPELPDAAFLALPAVIRSDRGDFLGLPGGQNVRRLVDVLAPEGAQGVSWLREGEGWSCAIPLGRAQHREIFFERTTTPRGNQVGLIRRMRINEAEATPVQLQEIFRQLRDQMSTAQHQKESE